MARQEAAEAHNPQPASDPAPSNGRAKENEHGDGVLVRRINLRTPPHLLEQNRQHEPRRCTSERKPNESTVDTEAAFKDKLRFNDRYFLANRAQDNERMKEQARRHKLLGERHEFSEGRAWRATLRLLEEDSPEGAKHYKKRMETIRLPEGIFARWLRDPGESILEVMQRTGSHVQVVPGKDVGLFSSLTLLGLPSQNAAAKRLLQESSLLGAVSGDDLNAMKSLADYHLRSEVSDRHGKAVKEDDDLDVVDESLHDVLDDIELAQLGDAVDSTTEYAPTRAVWSQGSATFDLKRTAKKSQSNWAPETPQSVASAPALSLTARIDDLTAPIPRHVWLKHFETLEQSQSSVRAELVALLTNPANTHLVTPLAAGKALEYLAHHMQFPAIRDIMNALKEKKLALDVDVFNKLLAAAAQAENMHAFHYIVNTMRGRGVTPNAGTWVHFLTLMMKRFPEEADQVRSRMQKKSVQADLGTQIVDLESFSAILLASFVESYPEASLQDFVKNISNDMLGVGWLTCYSANNMCNHLLKSGNTAMAFEVVDELVIRGGRPDVVTLNTFLTAAERDGNMEMAVAILRKFHDLHSESIPLARTNAERFTTLPRTHDLSITLNSTSFKLLCSLAWERKHYNCLRVFWRYACCAGHAAPTISKKLHHSIIFAAGDHDSAIVAAETSPRGRMWKAWAARFVIGVQAGLDARSADRVMLAARSVQTAPVGIEDAATGSTSTSTDLQSQQVGRPLTKKSAKRRRLQLLSEDPKEVQSLLPTRLLADIAEEAYQKDNMWKKTKFIGLPKGLKSFESADHMFEWMLQAGINVPVVVGDATSMKL